MRLSKTKGCLSTILFFVIVGLFLWGYVWAYDQWLVPFLTPRIGLSTTAARQTLSFLEVPLLMAVTLVCGHLYIKKIAARLQNRDKIEMLHFEQSVLPVRALPPFKAQTAVVKPWKIWFLVMLTVINLALNFPLRAKGSGSITGVFELLALINTWLSSRVSPLQLSADGVRIGWHRALSWSQVACAEIRQPPLGRNYSLRFFDARNRKIGQVIGLNSPDEWTTVLDYLHARAGR